MDVGTWLNSLGLDQYTDLFREQAIEADVLAELTEQHLIELGIPLGHRLRLLRAIGELAEGDRPVNGATAFRCARAAAIDGPVLRPGRLDRADASSIPKTWPT